MTAREDKAAAREREAASLAARRLAGEIRASIAAAVEAALEAVVAAVEAEREACAKIAEAFDGFTAWRDGRDETPRTIAALIRGRKPAPL